MARWKVSATIRAPTPFSFSLVELGFAGRFREQRVPLGGVQSGEGGAVVAVAEHVKFLAPTRVGTSRETTEGKSLSFFTR